MSAAKFAREYFKLNRLPESVIADVEAELQNYPLDYDLRAFKELLDAFIALYGLEGDDAVKTFKEYLIR